MIPKGGNRFSDQIMPKYKNSQYNPRPDIRLILLLLAAGA